MKKLTTFQWCITIICTFLMFFNRLIPPFLGLNNIGVSIICIIIAELALLLFVDLLWPVLMLILAFPVSGVYTIAQTLQMTLGHSVVNFVIFNTVMLYVLKETGILRRIAVGMISLPITKKSPWSFVVGLWLTIFLMACVIDITANVILFSILIIQILEELNHEKGSKLGEYLLLGNMVFSCLGYSCTPIGHSVPILGISMFAELQEISILKYTGIGLVIGIAFLVIYVLLMRYVFRLDISPLAKYDATTLKATLGPIKKSEKISLGIFIGVIIIWLSPDFFKGVPAAYKLLSGLGYVGGPLIALIAMSLIRVDDKPLLNFQEGMVNGVSWTAAYTMAAAMIIGSAINHPDAGIPGLIANSLGGTLGAMSPLTFVILIAAIATVITNFTSCTVAMTISATIALTLLNTGVITGVNIGALIIVLGITTGLAFMTAPAGTAASVTVGYGWVPPKTMFQKGAILSLIYGILVAIPGYYFASLFF